MLIGVVGISRGLAAARAISRRCSAVWPGVPARPGVPPMTPARSARSTRFECRSAVKSVRPPVETVKAPATSLLPTRPSTSVKRKRPWA